MKQTVLVICALMTLGAMRAYAQTPAPSQQQGEQSSARSEAPPVHARPGQLVRAAIHQLTEFLARANNPTPDQIRSFLDRAIAPYFDFDTMARWAAGPLYYRLTPPQQELLAARLRDLFLSALARNLGAYVRPLPRVQVYPTRTEPWARDATVRAVVIPANAYPIQLEFRFYDTPVGWKVFDVSANGVSALAYYRSYFTDLLLRYGPYALQG